MGKCTIEGFIYEYRGFYSYDEMGRTEWIVEANLGWYQKKIVYHYDYQGNITQKDFLDYDTGRNNYFYTSYTYDLAGRMSIVSTKHLPESYVQEGLYLYYASGKSKSLMLGNAQTINYYYNTRDWLTSLASTQFWEHLGYEQISEVGSQYSSLPQYTGNISWNSYYMSQTPFIDPVTHNTGSIVGYAYSYDNDNRLKTMVNPFSWTGFSLI